MSHAKHSVVTDALETLGTIIGEEQKRDAIHLAVEPVIAGETLEPGEHIGFLDKNMTVVGHSAKVLVGIVDPFVKGEIKKGQRFWLVVYPRQITSLRHVWEHPEFPKSADLESADPEPDPAFARTQMQHYVPLQQWAAEHDVTVDELLSHAKDHLESGDHWSEGGKFEGSGLPQNFWEHYEFITGEKVPDNYKGDGYEGHFLSCSC